MGKHLFFEQWLGEPYLAPIIDYFNELSLKSQIIATSTRALLNGPNFIGFRANVYDSAVKIDRDSC